DRLYRCKDTGEKLVVGGVCTASWCTKPACGVRESTRLSWSSAAVTRSLSSAILPCASRRSLRHLGAKVLVELDDLQLGFADLAAHAGDVGDELAALALQPGLVALQLHVARYGDEILLRGRQRRRAPSRSARARFPLPPIAPTGRAPPHSV